MKQKANEFSHIELACELSIEGTVHKPFDVTTTLIGERNKENLMSVVFDVAMRAQHVSYTHKDGWSYWPGCGIVAYCRHYAGKVALVEITADYPSIWQCQLYYYVAQNATGHSLARASFGVLENFLFCIT